MSRRATYDRVGVTARSRREKSLPFGKERREKLMRDLRFRSEFLAREPERAVVRKAGCRSRRARGFGANDTRRPEKLD